MNCIMETKLIIVYCILSVISVVAAQGGGGVIDGVGGDSCSLVDVEFHSAGTPVKQ